MDEAQRNIISSRLAAAFGDETQAITANRLNTTQTNVSRWISGAGIPSVDMLYYIARIYKVSIDWLLGLSDIRDIDGISADKLTYEHAAILIDKLFKSGNIEVPNMRQLNNYNYDEGVYDDDLEELIPIYDSDYIKVNDLALSFILRRRMKYLEIDEDDLPYWIESVVERFKGIRIINYNGAAPEVISTKSWSNFKQGDWAELLNQINSMTEDELHQIIKESKEGKEDGR